MRTESEGSIIKGNEYNHDQDNDEVEEDDNDHDHFNYRIVISSDIENGNVSDSEMIPRLLSE